MGSLGKQKGHIATVRQTDGFSLTRAACVKGVCSYRARPRREPPQHVNAMRTEGGIVPEKPVRTEQEWLAKFGPFKGVGEARRIFDRLMKERFDLYSEIDRLKRQASSFHHTNGDPSSRWIGPETLKVSTCVDVVLPRRNLEFHRNPNSCGP